MSTTLPDHQTQQTVATTRVRVRHRRGKTLEIGCAEHDCQWPSGLGLAIRRHGDIIIENRALHGQHWHQNGKSLREILAIIAHHDLPALRDLLGPDLIRLLAEAENVVDTHQKSV